MSDDLGDYARYLPNMAGLQAAARDLDDYRLDDQLAVAAARRDAAAAHGLPGVAATWQAATLALAEVRDERKAVRRRFEDATTPAPVLRPLTAEELADSRWPDETD